MKTRHSIQAEKFAIMQDPNNPTNWGIVWEQSGTEGGFTSESAARASARDQSGVEVDADESMTWEW